LFFRRALAIPAKRRTATKQNQAAEDWETHIESKDCFQRFLKQNEQVKWKVSSDSTESSQTERRNGEHLSNAAGIKKLKSDRVGWENGEIAEIEGVSSRRNERKRQMAWRKHCSVEGTARIIDGSQKRS